jgi:multicomponent K+:H+ antiporter subunit D
MHPHGITVAFYFVAAIAIAGMPPLTGFLGKVFVLQAAAPAEGAPVIWGVILGTSLALIVGFTRLGSALFWKTAPVPEGDPREGGPGLALPGPLAATAAGLPVAALAAMTLASGPVAQAMDRTAAQLIDRPTYIRAVLEPAERATVGLDRGPGAGDGAGGHGDGSDAGGGHADGAGETAPGAGGE